MENTGKGISTFLRFQSKTDNQKTKKKKKRNDLYFMTKGHKTGPDNKIRLKIIIIIIGNELLNIFMHRLRKADIHA